MGNVNLQEYLTVLPVTVAGVKALDVLLSVEQASTQPLGAERPSSKSTSPTWTLRLFEETPELDDGDIVVPQWPGLGLKFNEDIVKQYQVE